MKEYSFFNRDLSWLSFNERVLMEAENPQAPLVERIRFLSIYSSNLDEFYSVRMPVLMAVDSLSYYAARLMINRQQEKFGQVLAHQIFPALQAENIHWLYNEPIPEAIADEIASLFYNEVLAYIRLVSAEQEDNDFFAENNKLYQAVILTSDTGIERMELITVPSDQLPRLYTVNHEDRKYIVFLDDIIKNNLHYLFPGEVVTGVFNIKITRNAELNIKEEIGEDFTVALEKELKKRDLGSATRFLCQPGITLRHLYRIINTLNLFDAAIVEGGYYHHMKDLNSFPLQDSRLSYPKWPSKGILKLKKEDTLFELLLKKDLMVHVPYQNYNPVLRFFNEAANDSFTEEIYATLYRVADHSRIVNALMTAAKNGKKVTVMVELKARFDEANNIRWAAQMKAAGVKIIYSNTALKVHAKVTLVKRTVNHESHFLGLLATGNLNESTAKFYTDHILMTANQPMLLELQMLFGFLSKKKKQPLLEDAINFEHLLVAQFNLQPKFLSLIDREIAHAKAGLPAGITIKMNNLEEKILISKLYEASSAGVKINLIVRSVCCLIPGISGQSENIKLIRIVDRYLEHGRLFVFHHNENPEVYMGSADWMNRNIYGRIEVCFPVYDAELKIRLIEILNLQLRDTLQAVELNSKLENIYTSGEPNIRSQQAIYELLLKTEK